MPVRTDLMRQLPGIEIAGLSDVGCQRKDNEDDLTFWYPEVPGEFLKLGLLAVVADGMGGHEGGREASSLAVQTVRDVFREADRTDPQGALLNALREAHRRIRAFAEQHPHLHGMGTTCTAILVRNRHLYFAHVGDTRLYLLRGGRLGRRTRDHSYVGRLVESGVLSRAEAEHHPQRHILTAALGSGEEIFPESPETAVELQNGDLLLLCTDGLWDVVPDQDILPVLVSQTPEEACRELVRKARENGGPDNITLQIIQIRDLAAA